MADHQNGGNSGGIRDPRYRTVEAARGEQQKENGLGRNTRTEPEGAGTRDRGSHSRARTSGITEGAGGPRSMRQGITSEYCPHLAKDMRMSKAE